MHQTRSLKNQTVQAQQDYLTSQDFQENMNCYITYLVRAHDRITALLHPAHSCMFHDLGSPQPQPSTPPPPPPHYHHHHHHHRHHHHHHPNNDDDDNNTTTATNQVDRSLARAALSPPVCPRLPYPYSARDKLR